MLAGGPLAGGKVCAKKDGRGGSQAHKKMVTVCKCDMPTKDLKRG